ncbi:MAG: TIGR03619 family F420-dependent LLM class oxidoreductase [Caulobacterales bacterium]
MAPPVKVGINIVPIRPEHTLRYAKHVEDLGFDAIWHGEHVALSHRSDWWREFPGMKELGDKARTEMVPFTPDTNFMDPMATLAAIAGITSRVRLGIGIYMLALRDPVLVGRTISTVDLLSNGRLDMAVGLGWTADEYTYTGNNWKTRGKRMNEIILALRALFEQERPTFHGEFFHFDDIGFQPKPAQKNPRFPILIGGGGGPAEVRAAKLGDGWHGHASNIPRIKELLKEYGRENDPFRFSCILFGETPMEKLEELANQGVETVVVTPWKRGERRADDRGEGAFRLLEDYAKSIGLA